MPPRKRAAVSLSKKSEEPVSLEAKQVAFSARRVFDKCVDKQYAPQEMGDPMTGIPLHGALPLQYILGLNVIPLRQAISLVGKPGSLKSQMGWWFMSRFLKYSEAPGIGVYLDVESKTNDNLVRGILNDDYLYSEMIMRRKVRTVEELSATMSEYSKSYDAAVPDQGHPMMFLLDSMGALITQEELESQKKGVTPPGYLAPRRASLITDHLKAWTLTNLQDRPMALVVINHLKEKLPSGPGGANFAPEKGSPGGAHKDFLNLATIEMIKERGGNKLRTEARSKVWMQTLKASTADTGLKICVVMRTTGPDKVKFERDIIMERLNETEDNYQRYHVDIDWDTSLVELLTRESGKVTIEKAKLNEVCHITGSGNKLKCSRLGLKDVNPKELGHAIHNDPDLVRDLQDVIGVARHPHFTGGPLSL